MSNINLSLDAIIARTKANKKPHGQAKPSKTAKKTVKKIGGGLKKGNNGFKKDALFTKAIPAGKWRHDKFDSVDSVLTPLPVSTLDAAFANKKVRLNISNLAPTVTTADLKEVFASYSITSAVVHYGENGEHLGTGEVSLKKKDALKAISDFKGVAIDGSRITLAIIDGAVGASIFSRVQMAKKVDTIKKIGAGAIKKRSTISHPQKARAGKKITGGKKAIDGRLFSFNKSIGKKATKIDKTGKLAKTPKTEAELDAELDAYMKTSEN